MITDRSSGSSSMFRRPSHSKLSNSGAICRKRSTLRYCQGKEWAKVTAAGPLPIFTGFPIKSFWTPAIFAVPSARAFVTSTIFECQGKNRKPKGRNGKYEGPGSLSVLDPGAFALAIQYAIEKNFLALAVALFGIFLHGIGLSPDIRSSSPVFPPSFSLQSVPNPVTCQSKRNMFFGKRGWFLIRPGHGGTRTRSVGTRWLTNGRN